MHPKFISDTNEICFHSIGNIFCMYSVVYCFMCAYFISTLLNPVSIVFLRSTFVLAEAKSLPHKNNKYRYGIEVCSKEEGFRIRQN